MSNAYVAYLEKCIRQASRPDDPQLIGHWLDLMQSPAVFTSDICTGPQSHKVRWCSYKQQCHLLLDAIADELLPASWRCSCLDSIYRPLQQLQALAETDAEIVELQQLRYELNQTCYYALQCRN